MDGAPADNQTNVTTRYGYDPLGNRTAITNALAAATTFRYDALSRLTLATDPLNHATAYGYDKVGNRTAITDANGAITHYTFDPAGRPLTIDYLADGTRVGYAYDLAGNRLVMTDSVGTTRYSYDSLYRPTSVTDPYRQVITYTYDLAGNRTAIGYPDDKVVSYSYDEGNRLIEVTDWKGLVTGYDYDLAGRLNSTALPNGLQSRQTYDAAGRLVGIEETTRGDEVLGEYSLALDAVGIRTAVTETLVLGDLIFADGFETGDLTRWNPGARLLGEGERYLSVTSRAVLDGRYGLQVESATAPRYVEDDMPAAEVRYGARFYLDPNSVSAQCALYPCSHQEDLLVGQSANVDSLRVQFRYYRATSLSAPQYQVRAQLREDSGSYRATNWYTLSDQPHSIEITWQAASPDNSFLPGYIELWLDGVLKQNLTSANNAKQRVSDVRLGRMNTEGTWTGALFFDAFESRRRSYIGPLGTPAALVTTAIQYGYDPLGRLTRASYDSGQGFEYTYDAAGNRLTQHAPEGTTTYTYDAANRLTAVDGQGYVWDNAGRLLKDGQKEYTYDQADHLTTVTASGLTWSARYNGDGMRLSQMVNGAQTDYTLDPAALLVTVLAEKTATGSRQYVYGLGDSPLGGYDGSDWTYMSGRDPLNSVRQETDAEGRVLTARRFDPYGVPLGGDGGQPFGYTGEIWDNEIGLQWLRARWYSPWIAQFTSRDPWTGDQEKPMSYNSWLYAYANPLVRVDPTGFAPIDPTEFTKAVAKALQDAGWQIVGDINSIKQNMNGPDLVAIKGTVSSYRVLLVELKDQAGAISLSKLPLDVQGLFRQGSVDHVLNRVEVYKNSSNAQLQLTCQTVLQASKAGGRQVFETAIYSFSKVSAQVQQLFGVVGRVQPDLSVTIQKGEAVVQQGEEWNVPAAFAGASASIQAAVQSAPSVVDSLSGFFVPFVIMPREVLDQMMYMSGVPIKG